MGHVNIKGLFWIDTRDFLTVHDFLVHMLVSLARFLGHLTAFSG